MEIKEAIEFMKNDIFTISIIDQSIDEYHTKINDVISLLQQGEKYRQIWGGLKRKKINRFKDNPQEIDKLSHYTEMEILEQKYFPKEAKQDYPESEE